jgi:Fur family ferric uptake transcriptional regulator
MSDIRELLRDKLRSSGHSLTHARLCVFMALKDTEPQTMRRLISNLPDIDRASVYRTIDLFIELHIVERLQLGWKYKLELSDEFSFHHHHMMCTNCHALIAIHEDNRLEAFLEHIAQKADFTATGHQIEIRGLCKNCKS